MLIDHMLVNHLYPRGLLLRVTLIIILLCLAVSDWMKLASVVACRRHNLRLLQSSVLSQRSCVCPRSWITLKPDIHKALLASSLLLVFRHHILFVLQKRKEGLINPFSLLVSEDYH